MNDMGNLKTSAELLAKKQGSTSAFIVYPFLLLLLFIFIFLFFGRKETYIEAYGVLDSPDLSTKIVSPSNTAVTNINIDNGSTIRKGDILMEFDSTTLHSEVESINKTIEEKEEQIIYINDFLDSVNNNEDKLADNKFGYHSRFIEYLNRIENFSLEDSIKYAEIDNSNKKISDIDNSINKKNLNITDYNNLIKYIDGESSSYTTSDPKIKESFTLFVEEISSSSDEVLNSVRNSHKTTAFSSIDGLDTEIISLLDEKNQLNTLIETSNKQIELNKLNLENEKNNIISETEAEKSIIVTELETEKQNLKTYESLISKNTILAPTNGTFEFLENVQVGSVMPEGTALGEMIKTDKNLDVNLNISILSSDISNIYEGQKIRFTINTRNDNKKKVVIGEIQSISVQPRQTENGSYYLVYANIEENQDEFFHGLEGTVSIITGENTYKNIIMEKLFG